jgi:hypothetical protein
MNLPSSLVVTVIIVLGIWLAVVFQPQAASQVNGSFEPKSISAESIATAPQSEGASKAVPIAAVKPLGVAITGITAVISLSEVDVLWEKLNADPQFMANLTTTTPTMYAYYRDFNADYSKANVSVGYKSGDIKLGGLAQIVAHEGFYQTLLSPSFYEQAQLLSAWQKIDYQRSVVAVLEKHNVNEKGEINRSALSVLYKD